MRRSALLGGLLPHCSALLLTRAVPNPTALLHTASWTHGSGNPARVTAARGQLRTLAMSAEGQEALDFDKTRLYPQPPLVSSGMLDVSDLHKVAWYEYGNPQGKPVLFVHGGPGSWLAPLRSPCRAHLPHCRRCTCWQVEARRQ